MCFWGLSLKPTRLLCSSELLDDVQMRCPGGHRHVKLKGKMRDPQTGYWVFRTLAAQVYPWALCATMAEAIAALYNEMRWRTSLRPLRSPHRQAIASAPLGQANLGLVIVKRPQL